MTPLVDRDGRIFGRVNLVDAVCAACLIGLVPLAYASWLLFRPARPLIRSVERSEVNQEERRIANGLVIQLKLKVRGEHLTPMLRASIDSVSAIGFTFESPASADVIIGDDVPLGTHDLILYDGAQEVARARGAVVILPAPGAAMRVVGTLIQLDEPTARSLQPLQRFEVNGRPAAEFLKLGDVEPDRHRIKAGSGYVEADVAGSWQRPVVLRIHCQPDPDATVCRIATTTLGDPTLSVLTVPGSHQPLRVLVGDIVPDAEPHMATARLSVERPGELLGKIRVGDRDMRGGPLDARAASVVEVRRVSAPQVFELILRLGVDRTREGWRYKAQSIEPATPFSFVTDRYALAGFIQNVILDGE